MVKRLAHKTTKEILTDVQIREKRMNTGEFTANWHGRIHVLNPVDSAIAKQMGIAKEGEYALKVR